MRGTIDKIWSNTTKKGQEYRTVRMNGQLYNVWDSKYFDQLQEGEDIEYQFKESGNYMHITDMHVAGGNHRTSQNNHNSNHNNSYIPKKDKQIARMSCLKSASEIMAPVQLDPDAKKQKVIDTAKFFERYVFDDGLDDMPPEPYGGNNAGNNR